MDSKKSAAARAASEKRGLLLAAVGFGVLLAVAIALLRRPAEPPPKPIAVEAASAPEAAPVEEETITPAPEFPQFEAAPPSVVPAPSVETAHDAPPRERADGTWEGSISLPSQPGR